MKLSHNFIIKHIFIFISFAHQFKPQCRSENNAQRGFGNVKVIDSNERKKNLRGSSQSYISQPNVVLKNVVTNEDKKITKTELHGQVARKVGLFGDFGKTFKKYGDKISLLSKEKVQGGPLKSLNGSKMFLAKGKTQLENEKVQFYNTTYELSQTNDNSYPQLVKLVQNLLKIVEVASIYPQNLIFNSVRVVFNTSNESLSFRIIFKTEKIDQSLLKLNDPKMNKKLMEHRKEFLTETKKSDNEKKEHKTLFKKIFNRQDTTTKKESNRGAKFEILRVDEYPNDTQQKNSDHLRFNIESSPPITQNTTGFLNEINCRSKLKGKFIRNRGTENQSESEDSKFISEKREEDKEKNMRRCSHRINELHNSKQQACDFISREVKTQYMEKINIGKVKKEETVPDPKMMEFLGFTYNDDNDENLKYESSSTTGERPTTHNQSVERINNAPIILEEVSRTDQFKNNDCSNGECSGGEDGEWCICTKTSLGGNLTSDPIADLETENIYDINKSKNRDNKTQNDETGIQKIDSELDAADFLKILKEEQKEIPLVQKLGETKKIAKFRNSKRKLKYFKTKTDDLSDILEESDQNIEDPVVNNMEKGIGEGNALTNDITQNVTEKEITSEIKNKEFIPIIRDEATEKKPTPYADDQRLSNTISIKERIRKMEELKNTRKNDNYTNKGQGIGDMKFQSLRKKFQLEEESKNIGNIKMQDYSRLNRATVKNGPTYESTSDLPSFAYEKVSAHTSNTQENEFAYGSVQNLKVEKHELGAETRNNILSEQHAVSNQDEGNFAILETNPLELEQEGELEVDKRTTDSCQLIQLEPKQEIDIEVETYACDRTQTNTFKSHEEISESIKLEKSLKFIFDKKDEKYKAKRLTNQEMIKIYGVLVNEMNPIVNNLLKIFAKDLQVKKDRFSNTWQINYDDQTLHNEEFIINITTKSEGKGKKT